MLVDHDSWEIEYEGCKRGHHQLLVQLNDRNKYESQSSDYKKVTAAIYTGIEQLRKDVSHLKDSLDNAINGRTYPVTELERRQNEWAKLSSQLRAVEAKFDSSTFSRPATASVWQESQTPAPSNIPMDVETLRQRQSEIQAEQNRGLESLSTILSRQRVLASDLANEVTNQNDLLDNIGNSMDQVESGLQRETRSIGLINRRDSTWGYWLVIIALFVAILLVTFL